ncbi:claudin-34 [Ambystoma mexicanum]|uniref:claudin-34 n=1 Tax=Ambystoma mexicanum TaxID=8296 RepID=UPI0037E90866
MPYLAHSANLQLAAFAFSTVGWILSAITTGLVQWRVWHITNNTVINSGIAWVGIWRTCFFSNIMVSSNLKNMYCQEFSTQQSFVPPEIFVAQGLMVLAIILGLSAKISTVWALKNVYQGTPSERVIVRWFIAGGALNLAAGLCVLIPVAWNLHSVMLNSSVYFPKTFNMPSSPQSQDAGAAIALGLISAILMVLSGSLLLSYRLPKKSRLKVHPVAQEEGASPDGWSISTSGTHRTRSFHSARSVGDPQCSGIQNAGYEQDDYL